MTIKILPPTVAAQIAAGEVVERPASVVKELLENALDAGATAIIIDIRGAGSQLIRIRDNGHGIPSDEIETALERHATSKITEIDDLSQLHTLGFRGEALHSIASVSRLTLTTRHHEEEIGARIAVDGGQILEIRQMGVPVGTTLEIADLFYNVPARRKFLKSDATERRHIVTIITQYAMAYPDVRFQLTVDGKENFHSTGSGDLADVIIATMGLDIIREMVEVSPLPPPRPDLPYIEVYGFTTTPNIDRSNRTQIHLFVNGRLIADQRLTYAVVQAYHTLLPSGRYPMAVLMIQIAPDLVDVNVHPTKAEVRFQSANAVFSAVQRAVRSAIMQQPETPTISTFPSTPEDREKSRRLNSILSAGRNTKSTTPLPDNQQLDLDFELTTTGQYGQHKAPSSESDNFYPHYETPKPPYVENQSSQDDFTAIPDRMGTPQRPRTLPILRVVGQVSATYIIAEGPAGMYLIDQHAAHERILYEQFMAAYQAQQITVQQVLDTATIDLNVNEMRLLEEYYPQLTAIGFEIEEFGKNTFRLLSVPAILTDRDPADAFLQVLQDVEIGDVPAAKTIEDKIVRRVCKTAAVKAGQILSHAEMQGLIRQLERCENPHTCPHGRPTLIHLSNHQLEKEFGRT